MPVIAPYPMKNVDDVVEHRFGNLREKAYPEDVVHYQVGIDEAIRDPVFDLSVCRLTDDVAGEQRTRCYFCIFQKAHYIVLGEGSVGPNHDGKTEPARLTVKGCLGQDKEVFQVFEPCVQDFEVATSIFQEIR